MREVVNSVVIHIAGDSGDGVQLAGSHLSAESALAGNNLATLPDFPAEIRAPAGTLAGVSGFRLHFSSELVHTPGDRPDALVALNAAAYLHSIAELPEGMLLVLNEDGFTDKTLKKLGMTSNPCEDPEVGKRYRRVVVPITRLNREALEPFSLSQRQVDRSKNFFLLGILLWLYERPSKSTIDWIEQKFALKPELLRANKTALEAGMTVCEATEIFPVAYTVPAATQDRGEYKRINGTQAMAYGLVSAAQKSGLPLFFGAYPITPASDLLHEMASYTDYGVQTFQAEDEIAAVCACIGAAYAGALAISSSSGPGIALKSEALGLAVSVELPLVIINSQRGGPSTGLPTKTEQSDLFQAVYGRFGETPLCVLAASSADSAFRLAYEACRIAVKYMTPVMLLSEGYINNCSNPWKIPDPAQLADFEPAQGFPSPEALFSRNENTLARPWILPGTKDLQHRIGGLEKDMQSGAVSYDPDNHHAMVMMRKEKIERIQAEIPDLEIKGVPHSKTLLIGWGGTLGSISEAVRQLNADQCPVSQLHLEYLSPLPVDLGCLLEKYELVIAPEINTGQLSTILRSEYLVDVKGINLVKGQPLRVSEIVEQTKLLVKENQSTTRKEVA